MLGVEPGFLGECGKGVGLSCRRADDGSQHHFRSAEAAPPKGPAPLLHGEGPRGALLGPGC